MPCRVAQAQKLRDQVQALQTQLKEALAANDRLSEQVPRGFHASADRDGLPGVKQGLPPVRSLFHEGIAPAPRSLHVSNSDTNAPTRAAGGAAAGSGPAGQEGAQVMRTRRVTRHDVHDAAFKPLRARGRVSSGGAALDLHFPFGCEVAWAALGP